MAFVFTETPTDLSTVPTVAEWFERLMSRQWSQSRISTRERRALDYNLRIASELGSQPLDRLSFDMLEAWLYDHLRRDGNRRCVQGAYETLRLMLDIAVRQRVVAANPLREVPYPTAQLVTRQRRTLTRREYLRLLAGCSRLELRVMVRLLCEAGLRISEAIELRFDDIDLACTINVQRRAYHTRSGERDIDLPKSRKSRHVAIPRSLAAELGEMRASRSCDETDLVLTRCSSWTRGEHLPHTAHSLRNQLYRLATRTGMPRVSPHDLRATGATIAAHNGVPMTLIQAQLGHSRIQTTERYVHMPDTKVLAAYAAVFE